MLVDIVHGLDGSQGPMGKPRRLDRIVGLCLNPRRMRNIIVQGSKRMKDLQVLPHLVDRAALLDDGAG